MTSFFFCFFFCLYRIKEVNVSMGNTKEHRFLQHLYCLLLVHCGFCYCIFVERTLVFLGHFVVIRTVDCYTQLTLSMSRSTRPFTDSKSRDLLVMHYAHPLSGARTAHTFFNFTLQDPQGILAFEFKIPSPLMMLQYFSVK